MKEEIPRIVFRIRKYAGVIAFDVRVPWAASERTSRRAEVLAIPNASFLDRRIYAPSPTPEDIRK